MIAIVSTLCPMHEYSTSVANPSELTSLCTPYMLVRKCIDGCISLLATLHVVATCLYTLLLYMPYSLFVKRTIHY